MNLLNAEVTAKNLSGKKSGAMNTGERTYRVSVIEWIQSDAYVEAVSLEAAERAGRDLWATYEGRKEFRYDRSGIHAVIVNEP